MVPGRYLSLSRCARHNLTLLLLQPSRNQSVSSAITGGWFGSQGRLSHRATSWFRLGSVQHRKLFSMFHAQDQFSLNSKARISSASSRPEACCSQHSFLCLSFPASRSLFCSPLELIAILDPGTKYFEQAKLCFKIMQHLHVFPMGFLSLRCMPWKPQQTIQNILMLA